MKILKSMRECAAVMLMSLWLPAWADGITISIVRSEAVSPDEIDVEYYVSADGLTDAGSLTYDVSLEYMMADEFVPTILEQTTTAKTSHVFEMTNLPPDSTITAVMKVSATVPGVATPLTAETEIKAKTLAIPILIGTLPGGNDHIWSANYGIRGEVFDADTFGRCYYYTTSFVGEGAFRFISKLGRSTTDWSTVDKEPIYAPSQDRQDVTFDQWYPYEVFIDTNSPCAWRIPNFRSGDTSEYTVQLSFKKKAVLVVHQDYPTDVSDVSIDNADGGTVDVYNMQGTMLRHGIAKSEATLNLAPGLYIIGHEKIYIP